MQTFFVAFDFRKTRCTFTQQVNAGALIQMKLLQVTFIHIWLIGKGFIGQLGETNIGTMGKHFPHCQHRLGRTFGIGNITYRHILMAG